MTIIEELKNRGNEDDIAKALEVLAKRIVKDAENHLSLITTQLPTYDIHDKTHSDKILEYMERLVCDEIIKKLSSYELFLLYMSAYLHDCAMALPAWEHRLLTITEGMKGFVEHNLISNDGKPPYKTAKAINFIKENKEKIYVDFTECKKSIFSCDNEDEMIRDLAERLIHYQNFRNECTDRLRKIAESGDEQEYLKESDRIRYDFIRCTHAKRVAKYIQNLGSQIENNLNNGQGRAIANDLGKVCCAHGEQYEYIKELDIQKRYDNSGSVNLQFIAIMLRLGDVLHFSFDRAPKSLFAEKMIQDEESRNHWKAKMQGIQLYFAETYDNLVIGYTAYFEDPSSYYFFEQYQDWVDQEINNYFRFYHGMCDINRYNCITDRYKLNICRELDRNQIDHDDTKFQPKEELKFTLNQKSILELLMGVGLYKDKYLCLRELYQNSLDACRCMRAIKSKERADVKGNIEFGLGKSIVDGKEQRYLYCLDNGIGMTRDIVENYLLKIGNSYYKSKEFQRFSAEHNNSFTPTSQFGIGILSCFMLGNRLEITTTSLKNNNTIAFCVESVHENFYYFNVNEIDKEKIGGHGTIVKIYLNDNMHVYNRNIGMPKFNELIRWYDVRNYGQENLLMWENHIYNHIYRAIGIPNKDIKVNVRLNNCIVSLKPWLRNFDFDECTSNVKYMYNYNINVRYRDDIKLNKRNGWLKKINEIKLKVTTKNIEFIFLLNLPKENVTNEYLQFSNSEYYMCEDTNVFINGVSISSYYIKVIMHCDWIMTGNLNFYGNIRPKISADRSDILSLNKKLTSELFEIKQILSNKIINFTHEYIINNNFNLLTKQLVWEYIFNKFKYLSYYFINNITSNDKIDFNFINIKNPINNQSIRNYLIENNTEIQNIDFRNISHIDKTFLISKLTNAKKIEINNNNISFKANCIHEFDMDYNSNRYLILDCEVYNGIYNEYDLVTSFWPIIPNKLFQLIDNRYIINEKTIYIKRSYGGLVDLPQIDSLLINPKYGIFELSSFANNNKVARFERNIDNFYFTEIKDYMKVYNIKKQYVIYTFISPRELTKLELIDIQKYKDRDYEYYKGAIEGWSILFLDDRNYIISSGINKLDDMIAKIEPSFWEEHSDITYMLTDGTVISPSMKVDTEEY